MRSGLRRSFYSVEMPVELQGAVKYRRKLVGDIESMK